MIDGLTNAGSLPVLERMFQFAGARHRLISNNIANFDTPYYRAQDVSPEAFQAQLGEAVDRRRDAYGNLGGELEFDSTDEVLVDAQGLRLDPHPIGENILFHDQNDRDLERTMQALAENFMMFRAAADLMKHQHGTLMAAITESP